MTQKERMLAELPYKMAGNKELIQDWLENKKRVDRYNRMKSWKIKKLKKLFRDIVGKCGEEFRVEQPIHFDFGRNIEIGENFFANYNFTVLDVAKVTIGDNVMIAPNVSIYAAGHPLHPESRNSGYEYGASVTIGNNTWIGGSVIIVPGVTIGDNAVIGAGSVVTKDIPANMLAAGNPCRLIREITEADRDYYFKNRKFDIPDYLPKGLR